MKDTTGHFMEPQNFSVNDGDGIRTILFFAGCPLCCQWCSNPESFTAPDRVAYYEDTCLNCGRCTEVCPYKIEANLNSPFGREKCNSCGACVEVCPTKSRKHLVSFYGEEALLSRLGKQKIFYRYSGGGVTFSGGEATLQIDMLRQLSKKLYDSSVNLAIETCGYFNFDEVKTSLKRLDLIFVDIKQMDSERHKFYTGVGNEIILENIARMKELAIPIVVRIPLIEGVNSDSRNIRETARFVKDKLVKPQIEILPYHSFGNEKYEAMGLKKPDGEFRAPSPNRIEEIYKIIESEGVEIVSYR